MKILKNMALLGLLCSGYSMMAMDEDEDFKRAIAESLKESQQGMGGSQAGRTQMPMTSFGQSSSSRRPQVTNSNRPPLSKAEREAAQAEAEFEEQMRAAIAASKQEMVGSQARQAQMPMTSFGQSSSSRQPQVTNSNRPLPTTEEAAKKIQKFYKRKKLADAGIRTGAGIKIFGSDESPIELELEKVRMWDGTIIARYPTEKTLTELLNRHEQDRDYIPDLPKVIVKKINTIGAGHGALFAAYRDENERDKPLLFLKVSQHPSVAKDLEALQKGPVGRFGFMARSNKELPIIVLQEVFFIYKDKENKKHTIEVMHLAHGEMLSSLMEKAQEDQSYAEKVGKALGLFHAYFMNYHNSDSPTDWTTMIHGDFNTGNVFFDKTTSRVYFIDNGGMREGRSPSVDIATLGMPLSMHGLLRYPENKRNWWSHFIKGYLSAYPVNKRKLMLDYLLSDRNDTTALEKEEIRRNLNTFFEQACQR